MQDDAQCQPNPRPGQKRVWPGKDHQSSTLPFITSVHRCWRAPLACCFLQHQTLVLTVMLPCRLNHPGMYSYEAE